MAIEGLFTALATLAALILLMRVWSTFDKTFEATVRTPLQVEKNDRFEITAKMINAGAIVYLMRSSSSENTSSHANSVAREMYSAMEAARLSNNSRVHRFH